MAPLNQLAADAATLAQEFGVAEGAADVVLDELCARCLILRDHI
ncbi:MAG: hypothetical protein ABSE82_09305 [Nitrososphaerales archaeon]